MKEWRNDPCCAHNQDHTDRWDRVLLTFGENVEDQTLTVMTAAEAQTYVNRGWTRWIEVTAALRELENRAATVASAIADATIVSESGTKEVSLAGAFSDGDGDALTITATSSDDAKATVIVAADQSKLTVAGMTEGTATITVTAEDADGNTVSDNFDVLAAEAEAKGEGATPVLNLSCIAETDRVAFLWNAPEWSGVDLYAYDYQLTLPGGRSESGRLIGSTLLYRLGSYQSGGQTSVIVAAVYETADGDEISSSEATLACYIE